MKEFLWKEIIITTKKLENFKVIKSLFFV